MSEEESLLKKRIDILFGVLQGEQRNEIINFADKILYNNIQKILDEAKISLNKTSTYEELKKEIVRWFGLAEKEAKKNENNIKQK